PVRMDAGIDARTATFVGNLANFSLRFNSVIVIDSGSSFVKAAAVGLSDSVAAKALSPIRIVILLPIDLPRGESCSVSSNGPAKASASVNTSDMIEALCTMFHLLLRQDPHGCRPGAGTDHRVQVRTVRILRAIRVVDAIVHRTVNRFEPDFVCHTRGTNSPGLLLRGRLIPAGLLPVVAANVQAVIDDNRPDPRWRAVDHAVLAERRDVQIVRSRDSAQLLGFPFHQVLLERTCFIRTTTLTAPSDRRRRPARGQSRLHLLSAPHIASDGDGAAAFMLD